MLQTKIKNINYAFHDYIF